LEDLFRGYGWTPYFVEGSDPDSMHQAMAATVETLRPGDPGASTGMPRERRAQAAALADDRVALSERMGRTARSRRSPTRRFLARPPSAFDRRQKNPEQLRILEKWMHDQKPEELFDQNGKLVPELKELAPHSGTAA